MFNRKKIKELENANEQLTAVNKTLRKELEAAYLGLWEAAGILSENFGDTKEDWFGYLVSEKEN